MRRRRQMLKNPFCLSINCYRKYLTTMSEHFTRLTQQILSVCVCVWKWIWLYLLYFLYLWSRVKPIYWHAMGCNITIANEHVFPKIMWIALIHGLKAIRQLTLNHHSLKKKNLAYWKTVAVFCVCDLLSMLMFSTFPAFNYVFVSQPSHSGIPLWPPCRISSILGIPLVYWWLDVWTFVLLANSLLK